MPRFKNVFIAQIIGVGLISVYLSGSASAQAPVYFTLATTGCSKKHCSQTEDDAVNLSTPTPESPGEALTVYIPNSAVLAPGLRRRRYHGTSTLPLTTAAWRTDSLRS